jgi:Arm DNA-binding domain
LYLLVNPAGSKLWRLKYRIRGVERKLALGAYPEVSLADARTNVTRHASIWHATLIPMP